MSDPSGNAPAPEDGAPVHLGRASQFSLLLAIGVFLANMLGAWWVAFHSTALIARPLVEPGSAIEQALGKLSTADDDTHFFLLRLLDTELMIRTIQNQQALNVVALAVAFALMAVGFALFVMGAEGAFQLEGRHPSAGNVVAKATAPGLLCFVLSAGVVLVALRMHVEIEPGAFQRPAAEATTQAQELPEGPTLPEEAE